MSSKVKKNINNTPAFTEDIPMPPVKESGTFSSSFINKFIPATRWEWAVFGVIVFLGFILRFWALGDKALHHDESLHAYYSLQYMLHPDQYTYNPLLHGPFKFIATAFIFRIVSIFNGINDYTARILPAFCGTVLVALPFALRRHLGRAGALIACLLLAVSPTMVYFSRFFRDDIFIALFTMFMVVFAALYIERRSMQWFLLLTLSYIFSYATSENTFLTTAIFGTFLGGLIAWEIGTRIRFNDGEVISRSPFDKWRSAFDHAGLIAEIIYLTILAGLAFLGKHMLEGLSTTINNNQTASDQYVETLKSNTVNVVIPILIILFLFITLFAVIRAAIRRQKVQEGKAEKQLADRLNPRIQQVLDTILRMPWEHWATAVALCSVVFVFFFRDWPQGNQTFFDGIRQGVGAGIWQGLYYWLTQQQVARGGQPFYYYMLLLPLYEQLIVLFGILGTVRVIISPTRFRVFILYWFTASFALYSWAGEKMPWIAVHIVLPMGLLAAISLDWVFTYIWEHAQRSVKSAQRSFSSMIPAIGAYSGAVIAFLLLIPMIHSMYMLSFVDPAEGPKEMMIYVQTTPDVDTVMGKINALDNEYYNGQKMLKIGVDSEEVWPYAWYLRDYKYVSYNFPTTDPSSQPSEDVVLEPLQNADMFASQHPGEYVSKQYRLRAWWDEGYKPPPCPATENCQPASEYVGVGLWRWLSYGDENVPADKQPQVGLMIQRVWNWLWYRQSIGNANGNSYDFVFFVKKDLANQIQP